MGCSNGEKWYAGRNPGFKRHPYKKPPPKGCQWEIVFRRLGSDGFSEILEWNADDTDDTDAADAADDHRVIFLLIGDGPIFDGRFLFRFLLFPFRTMIYRI
jgi:hypothetical protein